MIFYDEFLGTVENIKNRNEKSVDKPWNCLLIMEPIAFYTFSFLLPTQRTLNIKEVHFQVVLQYGTQGFKLSTVLVLISE